MLNEMGMLRDLLNYVQGWYTELLSEQLCAAIKLHRLSLNMKITGYRVWNLSSKEKSSLYAVKKSRKKVNVETAPIYIEWKKNLQRLLLKGGLQLYTQHNKTDIL